MAQADAKIKKKARKKKVLKKKAEHVYTLGEIIALGGLMGQFR